MDALANAAKGAATDAVNSATKDLQDGNMPPGAANILKNMPGGLSGVAGALAGAAGAGSGSVSGSGAAKTKASNEYMCDGFQEMFKKNQAAYNTALFDSLGKYFQDEPSKARLTAMLEQNIGNYIRSSQFRGTTADVIKDAIGSVIRESLKIELTNSDNFKGMCGIIQKMAINRQGVGGGTRTKRKPRKKTVKRRN